MNGIGTQKNHIKEFMNFIKTEGSMKLVICNHAGTKFCNSIKERCRHKEPHEKTSDCSAPKCSNGEIEIKVKCIPYKEKSK